jgi:hypothetical protein
MKYDSYGLLTGVGTSCQYCNVGTASTDSSQYIYPVRGTWVLVHEIHSVPATMTSVFSLKSKESSVPSLHFPSIDS